MSFRHQPQQSLIFPGIPLRMALNSLMIKAQAHRFSLILLLETNFIRSSLIHLEIRNLTEGLKDMLNEEILV